MIAPLPPDEKERLEALRRYEILDSAPEQDFDDLNQLAAHICGTPIATITLVDETRQWFKSRVGLTGCETSREVAFCAHTILQKEVVVVPDARIDERFADNPLVTGDPDIRFYAGAPLITPDGFVLGTICVIDRTPRDLSAEKVRALQALSRQVVAQLELRRSLMQLRQSESRSAEAFADLESARALHTGLVNSMDGIVWEADAATFQFTFVSARAEHLLGFPAARWLADTEFWVSQIHPADREAVVDCCVAATVKKENHTFEYRMLAADGRAVWLRDIVTYVEEPGKPPMLRGIMLDITAGKQQEEALRLLGSAVEQARESILITDADLDLPGPRIVFVNPAFTKMTGYTAEEVLGNTPRLLQGPRTDKEVMRRLRQDLEGGNVFSGEAINYRKDGSEFYLEWQVAPIRDAAGKTTHFAAIQRDVTARKLMDDELQQSRDAILKLNTELEQRVVQRTEEFFAAAAEAERANRAKSEFLSRTSHELRTPLNAILGFGQLLEMEEDLGGEPRESVEQILNAGRHLLTLVNEVLDISNAESGEMSLALEPVPVDQLITATLSLIGTLGGTLHVDVERASPLGGGWQVLADPQRLKQVLLNLLSNAIKYNRPGGRVIVEFAPIEAAEPAVFRFSVQDTGYGISAEKMPRLFTPFDRLDAERAKSPIAGTGLGLALAKRMVELMGGRIGVESVVGEGSTFWVEVPLAENAVAAHEPSAPVPVPALDIPSTRTLLYIEDNVSNLRLVTRILARRPAIELLSAATGPLGLEMARAHQPDLILLDLNLPGLNGGEVLAELRADPHTAAIPVVMLTADNLPATRERMLAAGARDFLAKPVEVRALLGVFDQFIEFAPEVVR